MQFVVHTMSREKGNKVEKDNVSCHAVHTYVIKIAQHSAIDNPTHQLYLCPVMMAMVLRHPQLPKGQMLQVLLRSLKQS